MPFEPYDINAKLTFFEMKIERDGFCLFETLFDLPFYQIHLPPHFKGQIVYNVLDPFTGYRGSV